MPGRIPRLHQRHEGGLPPRDLTARLLKASTHEVIDLAQAMSCLAIVKPDALRHTANPTRWLVDVPTSYSIPAFDGVCGLRGPPDGAGSSVRALPALTHLHHPASAEVNIHCGAAGQEAHIKHTDRMFFVMKVLHVAFAFTEKAFRFNVAMALS